MTVSEAPEDTPAPELPADVAWRSLHPASVVVNLIPRAWQTLRSAWPLLLALLYGRANGQGLFDLSLLLLLFGLAVGNTLVHFLTLRYRVADGRMELKSGLLNRQVRVISADRVQNVEMVRNVFHRMSGLVEVRIETASGTEVEGLLSALSVEEATRLIDALSSARGEVVGPDEATGEVIVANGPSELLWVGATGTRVGAVALLLGLAFEGLTLREPVVDPADLEATTGLLRGVGGVAVMVAAVTGAWLLGMVTAVLRHHGFRLVQVGETLVAEQGLFTKRRADLRQRKVQLVTVVEPLLRRWLGFSSVWIETAAAREQGDGTQRSEAVVPYVEQQALPRVLGATLPLGPVTPAGLPLSPPHPSALVWSLLGALLRSGLLVAGLSWWLFPWGLLSLLVVPISAWAAVLDHRSQGWWVDERLVVARRGWWTRRTAWLAREKLQSSMVIQGPILRRFGLGVLQLRVAGSRVSLPILAMEEALDLQRRLLR